MQSRDPSTNVVLLEDTAAVLGVIMAAGCMGLTSLTGKWEVILTLTQFIQIIISWTLERECMYNIRHNNYFWFILIDQTHDHQELMRSYLFLHVWASISNSLSDSIPVSCLGFSTGNPYYDSLGSLGVGTLLGTVSAFLIYTNTEALLGRSIQAERVQKLTEFLENDPAVRLADVSSCIKISRAAFPTPRAVGCLIPGRR